MHATGSPFTALFTALFTLLFTALTLSVSSHSGRSRHPLPPFTLLSSFRGIGGRAASRQRTPSPLLTSRICTG